MSEASSPSPEVSKSALSSLICLGLVQHEDSFLGGDAVVGVFIARDVVISVVVVVVSSVVVVVAPNTCTVEDTSMLPCNALQVIREPFSGVWCCMISLDELSVLSQK